VDDNKNALVYPILVTITGRKSVAIQALAISQIYDQNEFLGSPAYNKNVSVSLNRLSSWTQHYKMPTKTRTISKLISTLKLDEKKLAELMKRLIFQIIG